MATSWRRASGRTVRQVSVCSAAAPPRGLLSNFSVSSGSTILLRLPEISVTTTARDIPWPARVRGGQRQLSGQAPPNVGLFFGCHLGENINIAALREVLALKERGGSIIVCDPRFSVLAGKADMHLMLRPGSDTAIIFGWLRAILDQHLQQAPLAADLPAGVLVELRRLLDPFTPAFVARLTDIDETILTETSLQLAAPDARVAVYQGRFTAWYGNDSQRSLAIRLLALVLDSLQLPAPRREGHLARIAGLVGDSGLAGRTAKNSRGVSGNRLLQKMLAGEVRTVGVWGSNPFHCYPEPLSDGGRL